MNGSEATASTKPEGVGQARAVDEKSMAVISLFALSDVDAFCAFLRAVHVRVDDVTSDTVKATIVGAPSELHERRELAGYVATWNALNPGRQATLVDA